MTCEVLPGVRMLLCQLHFISEVYTLAYILKHGLIHSNTPVVKFVKDGFLEMLFCTYGRHASSLSVKSLNSNNTIYCTYLSFIRGTQSSLQTLIN